MDSEGEKVTENPIPRAAVEQALGFARLDVSALRRGPHPDTGEEHVALSATVNEYSIFLLGLAVQFRTLHGAWAGHALASLAEGVQLEMSSDGETRFWFSGIRFEGF